MFNNIFNFIINKYEYINAYFWAKINILLKRKSAFSNSMARKDRLCNMIIVI